jgi:hypothetical protein
MSDPEILRPDEKDSSDDQPTRGPNLTLLYSLIALALAVAIGIAMMIVWPFYKSR